jgi:hypothetical protein
MIMIYQPLRIVLLGSLCSLIFRAVAVAGPLPAAPAGFTWQYVSSNTYTDNDVGTASLAASGNVGSFSVTPISETLSLTTFNQASAPSGQFYCITASNFTSSILASSSATIFNLNLAGIPEDYSGTLSLSSMSLGGTAGATGGPVSSSLTRTPGAALTIAPFGNATFTDAASGANSTNISLSSTGSLAINNGSNVTFTYSGNSVAFFAAAPTYTGPGWAVSGAASYSASITTNYDVYELVAIPEPNSAALTAAALLGLASRRRRR